MAKKGTHYVHIAHLCQVQSEMPFLGHQSGHYLGEVPHCDLSHLEPKLVIVCSSSIHTSSELHIFSGLACYTCRMAIACRAEATNLMVSKSEQQKLTSAHRPWKEGMNGWEAASGSKNVPFMTLLYPHALTGTKASSFKCLGQGGGLNSSLLLMVPWESMSMNSESNSD